MAYPDNLYIIFDQRELSPVTNPRLKRADLSDPTHNNDGRAQPRPAALRRDGGFDRRPYLAAWMARQEPVGVLVIQVSTGSLLFIARQTSSLRIGMCISSAPVACLIALPSAGATEIIGCSPTPRAP